jgi:two-component system, LytTR family, response regulator
MLKTIIIDDEPAARDKVQYLLANYCKDDVSVVAICKSGEEGLKAIADHQPDLIFLDVEMPFMTGFDLLRQLQETLHMIIMQLKR